MKSLGIIFSLFLWMHAAGGSRASEPVEISDGDRGAAAPGTPGLDRGTKAPTPPNDPGRIPGSAGEMPALPGSSGDAVAGGAWKAETMDREAQLAWGLRAIDPASAGATLAKLVAEKKVPLDGTGPWFELLGEAGGPAELQSLWDSLLVSYAGTCCGDDPTREIDAATPVFTKREVSARAMEALLTAARKRKVCPPARAPLAPLLFNAPDPLRIGALELVGIWKTPGAVAKLGELLDETDLPAATRSTALRALRAIGGDEADAMLLRFTTSEKPATP